MSAALNNLLHAIDAQLAARVLSNAQEGQDRRGGKSVNRPESLEHKKFTLPPYADISAGLHTIENIELELQRLEHALMQNAHKTGIKPTVGQKIQESKQISLLPALQMDVNTKHIQLFTDLQFTQPDAIHAQIQQAYDKQKDILERIDAAMIKSAQLRS